MSTGKLSNVQRAATRAALAELEKENDGRLAPEDVVDAAEPEDHPLHCHFEWDDGKAGRAYRIDQARRLIASITVTVTTSTTTLVAPYYVRDPSAGNREQGYRSVQSLRSDEDMARAAVLSEFDRVRDALVRAQSVAAALDMYNEISALIDQVVGLRQRLAPPEARQ